MDCFACHYRYADKPCGGDPGILASHYIANAAWTSNKSGELHWSWYCLNDAVKSDPEFAFSAMLLIMPEIRSPEDAAIFSAGPIEDLLVYHASKFIDRFEEHARISKRFGYFVSGVWLHAEQEANVVERIERIQLEGPNMDRGDEFPEE